MRAKLSQRHQLSGVGGGKASAKCLVIDLSGRSGRHVQIDDHGSVRIGIRRTVDVRHCDRCYVIEREGPVDAITSVDERRHADSVLSSGCWNFVGAKEVGLVSTDAGSEDITVIIIVACCREQTYRGRRCYARRNTHYVTHIASRKGCRNQLRTRYWRAAPGLTEANDTSNAAND